MSITKNNITKITKAEKREKIRQKAKFAPKGGTLAGQMQKMKTSRNYAKKNLNTHKDTHKFQVSRLKFQRRLRFKV